MGKAPQTSYSETMENSETANHLPATRRQRTCFQTSREQASTQLPSNHSETQRPAHRQPLTNSGDRWRRTSSALVNRKRQTSSLAPALTDLLIRRVPTHSVGHRNSTQARAVPEIFFRRTINSHKTNQTSTARSAIPLANRL